MKRFLLIFRNKFLLAITIFFVYALFLDENDIFTIISQSNKLSSLKAETNEMNQNLKETQRILNRLKYSAEVEKYAREKKLFKKDDEDIFVIFYE
ncbi:MAG: septum formation initiator family protein [Crocinitomicaceae bacterium]|nr:septum formation initiator family protein [Crocinitomicaceae bacterium]MDG1742497.1 septum formation initiator family protein [Crocinitomicaceae bacterium]